MYQLTMSLTDVLMEDPPEGVMPRSLKISTALWLVSGKVMSRRNRAGLQVEMI
jgi:hypothetical protein